MGDLKWQVYDRLPVALQNMIVSGYGRRILRERFGPEFERLSAFLERSERLDRDELRAFQDERLRQVVAHAYATVPHYRDVMDQRHLKPADIRTVDDLPKLPVLPKTQVVSLGDRLVSSSANKRSLYKAHTGGTTGTPLDLYGDRSVSLMNHACRFRLWRWAGVEFGRPFATLLGKPIVPVGQKRPPFWRYNASWNHLLLSCLHLKEENIPHYISAMREKRIEVLETYPSAAFLVARFLEAAGERLPLRCVMLSGEPLLPFEREIIEDRFNTRPFDAYSQAERVVFAAECERHEGLHLFSEFGVCEIVDEDGNPVREGTPGLIAGTSLHNMGMPLIRYTFNDVAARTDRTCECGRTLPMLEGLATREEDILVAPDGRMIPPVILSWGFRLVRGVRRAQLVQHKSDHLLVRFELDDPIHPEDEATFREYLKGKFGEEMTFEIERVEEIPLSPRGKYRRVISTVPLRWGHIETPNLHGDGVDA